MFAHSGSIALAVLVVAVLGQSLAGAAGTATKEVRSAASKAETAAAPKASTASAGSKATPAATKTATASTRRKGRAGVSKSATGGASKSATASTAPKSASATASKPATTAAPKSATAAAKPARSTDARRVGEQRVVAAYLDATGGTAAFEGERTLRVKGTINSMGMSGTFEAWSQAPNRTLTLVKLGPIRIKAGFDGTTAWRTDLNSQTVTLLDGKDLEAAIADAYFQNEQWARPDRGGGKIALGTKSFADDGVRNALEVSPPAGPARRLWFSDKTGQLVGIVSRRDQHEWSEKLSGYRSLAGRVRALATESGDPKLPSSYQRLRVDSVWANVPIDSSLFSPPSVSTGKIGWLERKGTAKLPFRYTTKHIWLKASLDGGPPADFLLDTGASLTAVDSGYAARIGLAREGSLVVQGMGAAGNGSYARVRTLRVIGSGGDGVELADLNVGVIDLAGDLEPDLRKVVGLLGCDFISRFVVEIDYDEHEIVLHDPETYVYRGDATPIPLGLAGGVPRVRVELDDQCSGEFLLDLGNGFNATVHGSMVRRCRMMGGRRHDVQVEGAGFGGPFAATLSRRKSIRIGPHRWEEPIVALSLTTSGAAGSKNYAGHLGNGALERFKCTLDVQRRALYLEPGRRFSERDKYARL